MKVLVTGGAGFIGHHLARELKSRGHEVSVLDNLCSGKRENIPAEIELIEADIADSGSWENLPSFDIVFHLAAMVSVVESQIDPIKCERENVHSVLHLIQFAREKKVKKIVLASSAAIYGDSTAIQLENQLPNPKSPYGLSKLSGEYLLNMAWINHRIPFVALRMFNVFGPGQAVDSAYASVIPKFMTRALQGESLIIHGDGSQTRDFIYVDQVVDYYIQAMESELVGVYNAGNNQSWSILQLANKVLGLCGQKVSKSFSAGRPGDIKDSRADIARLTADFRLVDFDFDRALRITYESYSKSY